MILTKGLRVMIQALLPTKLAKATIRKPEHLVRLQKELEILDRDVEE